VYCFLRWVVYHSSVHSIFACLWILAISHAATTARIHIWTHYSCMNDCNLDSKIRFFTIIQKDVHIKLTIHTITLVMRVSWLLRKLEHGAYATLSKKRFDTECRRFHLLMLTVNRENWRRSGGSPASEQFLQWFSHSLTMRLASQLSPFTHLSPRFHFRFEWMQTALGKTDHSLHFPHRSFSFLCWQWPSADEIVDILFWIALSTVWHKSRVLSFWSNMRPAL